jgi:hypothetical protein
MFKPFSVVMIEGIVVGILLICMYNIIDIILGVNYNQMIKLFISGFMFHILCEIFGVNIWYVKEYNKYINV